jgi:hypothetical protein
MLRSIVHRVVVGLGLSVALCPHGLANEPWPSEIDVFKLEDTPQVKAAFMRNFRPAPNKAWRYRFLDRDGDGFDDFTVHAESLSAVLQSRSIIYGGADLEGVDTDLTLLRELRPGAGTEVIGRWFNPLIADEDTTPSEPLPDFNGDGYGDMVVAGDPLELGQEFYWALDVVYGGPGVRGARWASYFQSTPGGNTSWSRIYIHEDYAMPAALEMIGDVTGDGFADIIVRDDLGTEFEDEDDVAQLHFHVIHGRADLPGKTILIDDPTIEMEAGVGIEPYVTTYVIADSTWAQPNTIQTRMRLTDIDGDGMKEFSSELWSNSACDPTLGIPARVTAFFHTISPGMRLFYSPPVGPMTSALVVDTAPRPGCTGIELWSKLVGGDIDGDGFDDAVIHIYDPADWHTRTKKALLVKFGDGQLRGVTTQVYTQNNADGESGKMRIFPTIGTKILSMKGLFDINGDGASDLVIIGEELGHHALFVLYGGTHRRGQTIHLSADTADVVIRNVSEPARKKREFPMYAEADINGDGFADLITSKPGAGAEGTVPRLSNYDFFVLFGGGARETATVIERFQVGPTPLRAIGGDLASVSKLRLGFDDGDDGAGGPSTERVTVQRNGDGASGIAQTLPGFILPMSWHVESDRTGWDTARVRMNYTDAAAEGQTEEAIRLFQAADANGPWAMVANQEVLPDINQVSGEVTQIRHLALASVVAVIEIRRVNDRRTNAETVGFSVQFNAPVTGVDAGDFAIVTDGSLSGVSVSEVTGSDTLWTVAVATGNGDGTLRLDLRDDDSIVAAGSIPLGGPGSGNGDDVGEDYLLDRSQGPVAQLATHPAHAELQLTWSLPLEPDFEAARILWSETGFPQHPGEGRLLYDGTADNAFHFFLENGKTYYYTAFARDDLGNYSGPVHVTGQPVEDYCFYADVNRDGNVNIFDVFEEAFAIINEEFFEEGDINKDGRLNIIDLQIVVNCILAG